MQRIWSSLVTIEIYPLQGAALNTCSHPGFFASLNSLEGTKEIISNVSEQYI